MCGCRLQICPRSGELLFRSAGFLLEQMDVQQPERVSFAQIDLCFFRLVLQGAQLAGQLAEDVPYSYQIGLFRLQLPYGSRFSPFEFTLI